MNAKETAIRNFVIKNYKMLNADHFDRKLYDKTKKFYFGNELKYKFQIPRDNEICDCFVDVLIKNNKIVDVGMLSQLISDTSFLRICNVDSEKYAHAVLLEAKQFALNNDEMKGLTERDKINKLREIAENESTKKIDQLILEKMEAYKRLPSIIDDIEFEEPIAPADEAANKEWWEILNLRQNPFPDLQGIFLIDKKLYEEVVVKTSPINRLLDQLNKDKLEIFHKAYLLGGNMGSGKTTIFDYLTVAMTLKRVEPIGIALMDAVSVAYYMQNFERELCSSIYKISKRYAVANVEPGRIDFEEARVLMLELQENYGVNGFVIFLDDLHKHQDKTLVFHFLSGLQIIKNKFTRENINVTFLVSGFPGWADRIKQDSGLMGFFDDVSSLILPDVSPELASAVIKKRLKAFSINPDKPIGVKDEFFRLVLKKVGSEINFANKGFRLYIEELLRHFKNKEFDLLSIDFTKINFNENIKLEVKEKLEQDIDFNDSIKKLIFRGGIKTKEIQSFALKILCEIYLSKGVSEQDQLFEEHKYYFKRLHESGFIQKYDRRGNLVWKISPFMQKLNEKIINEYSLSLEDYLVPIYAGSRLQLKEAEKINKQDNLESYETDLKYWQKNKFLDYPILAEIKQALELFSSIMPRAKNKEMSGSDAISDVDPAKIKESVWSLMKSIIRFESPSIIDISGESNIAGWILRHRKLEYAHQFIEMIADFKAPFAKSDIARLVSIADSSFKELWEELRKSIEIYKNVNEKPYNLSQNLLDITFSEYENLFVVGNSGKEFFESFKKFVTGIEDSLRAYLFLSNFLIFGPYHERRKYYSDDIVKYMGKSNKSHSTGTYESWNEFQDLNRGQYRKLFSDKAKETPFYRFIIKPVLAYWSTQDIDAFFNLFGDCDVLATHGKKDYVDGYKKDLPTFLRLACRFNSTLNQRIKNLLTSHNCVTVEDAKIKVVFGVQLKNSNEVVREIDRNDKISKDIPPYLYQHDITILIDSKYENRMMEKIETVFNEVRLNITEIDLIKVKFGIEYAQIMSYVAYLLVKGKIVAFFPYGDNIFIKKVG